MQSFNVYINARLGDGCVFSTNPGEIGNYYAKLPKIDLINALEMPDLVAWYLDDGSWHKRNSLMHLYTNSEDDAEIEALREKVNSLLGFYPKVYYDRKKDGRVYPYLCFNRLLSARFEQYVFRFVEENSLHEMYYKIGLAPGETIKTSYTFEDTFGAIKARVEAKGYTISPQSIPDQFDVAGKGRQYTVVYNPLSGKWSTDGTAISQYIRQALA